MTSTNGPAHGPDVRDHHAGCDGWTTMHMPELEQRHDGVRRLVCEQCGPTHWVGAGVTGPELRRMMGCDPIALPCTGCAS